jgi:hypothetical protein
MSVMSAQKALLLMVQYARPFLTQPLTGFARLAIQVKEIFAHRLLRSPRIITALATPLIQEQAVARLFIVSQIGYAQPTTLKTVRFAFTNRRLMFGIAAKRDQHST